VTAFFKGAWLVYLIHILLLSSLIAVSAVDLELWIIPIVVCWFATLAAVIGSGAAPWVINPHHITGRYPFPTAGPIAAALAAGAAIGLIISIILLETGLIKESYKGREDCENPDNEKQQQEPIFNDRLEICREILFVLPIIICSAVFYCLTKNVIGTWWVKFAAYPAVSGVFGSLWGFFIGCSVVWATRIFGTLAFGREAMGLGDVHLMGAAGAVLGALPVTVSFFIAPFFGLGWVVIQMFSKNVRQIPYGPFLSIGVAAAMIFNDRILDIWRIYSLSLGI